MMEFYKYALKLTELKKINAFRESLGGLLRRPNDFNKVFPGDDIKILPPLTLLKSQTNLSRNYISIPPGKPNNPVHYMLHETGHLMDKKLQNLRGPNALSLRGILRRENVANINARKLLQKYSKTPEKDIKDFAKSLSPAYKTYTVTLPFSRSYTKLPKDRPVHKMTGRMNTFLESILDRSTVEEAIPVVKSIQRNISKKDKTLRQILRKTYSENKDVLSKNLFGE